VKKARANMPNDFTSMETEPSQDPCENCANRKCAGGMIASWWDECVDSGFRLFPKIAGAKERGDDRA